MKCINCGTTNEEDALYCKRCGNLLETKDKKLSRNTNSKKERPKVKKKTKVKTKVKKVKQRQKKDSTSKNSFGKTVFIFFLVMIIILLLGISGILGYHIYSEEKNIEVPNLENLTYQEAEVILARKQLRILKKEKSVLSEDLDKLVIDQNKKVGEKVSRNTKVQVVVGKYEFSYKMEDFVGQNIDIVKNKLNHQKISYKIELRNTNNEDENDQVIFQTPKKGKKINRDTMVQLVVLKYEKKEQTLQDDKKELEDVQEVEPQEE